MTTNTLVTSYEMHLALQKIFTEIPDVVSTLTLEMASFKGLVLTVDGEELLNLSEDHDLSRMYEQAVLEMVNLMHGDKLAPLKHFKLTLEPNALVELDVTTYLTRLT